MRFIKKIRKSWCLVLLVVALVMLTWVAGLSAKGTTITVTSTADSGLGTLRQALLDAQSGDTITFDPAVFPPDAPATIALASPLPGITQGNLTIDGTGAGVIIDGSGISVDADCLALLSDGNTVQGLRVGGCVWTSVSVWGANNTIADNMLFGSGDGVGIWGTEAYSNTVTGNYIGTDLVGTTGLGNTNGVVIVEGAHNNTIGGDTPEERNVISGNADSGVLIGGEGTDNNAVIGNYIGTDASGTVAIPNGEAGIVIANGARFNTIGGDEAGEGNVISGNAFTGLNIWDAGTDNNRVSGNYIGTDASATVAVPNGEHGVKIENGARFNTIGGDTPGERNVISGNAFDGVVIGQTGTDNNTVIGNYIGTDASGTVAVPNGENGVTIDFGARFNTIGGATPGKGNVIAHNGGDGVLVDGSATTRNTISHNSITANGGLGIDNSNGGNTELAPPVITEAVGMTVTGTACAGCTLEFFSDEEDEGCVFEGSTTAESNGAFIFSRTVSFTGPNVTATATDADGNTSEFSASVSVPVLTIIPDVGTYGTRFYITGSGWAPGEMVMVKSFWPDGSPIGHRDYTADANGDINPSDWIPSPGEPAGIYTWAATGPTSGSVTKTFEVLPATEPLLAVYPDSAVVGETFYFGGSGFQPSENITLTLTGPVTVIINVTADKGGNFFAEWDSTGYLWGTYTVDAVGDQGSTASATFEVLPAARIYLPLITKNYQ